eukprot:TRINITY_DN67757_c3_g1_i5.p1 TRINITY_DN67757_c3_g1~~TRINITY_DN67757_c3_g1_i5.p1  ORF type:complete len:633 (+),score=33.68 TRINITY_DN67757_c3_g1_i5:191-1900(+)
MWKELRLKYIPKGNNITEEGMEHLLSFGVRSLVLSCDNEYELALGWTETMFGLLKGSARKLHTLVFTLPMQSVDKLSEDDFTTMGQALSRMPSLLVFRLCNWNLCRPEALQLCKLIASSKLLTSVSLDHSNADCSEPSRVWACFTEILELKTLVNATLYTSDSTLRDQPMQRISASLSKAYNLRELTLSIGDGTHIDEDDDKNKQDDAKAAVTTLFSSFSLAPALTTLCLNWTPLPKSQLTGAAFQGLGQCGSLRTLILCSPHQMLTPNAANGLMTALCDMKNLTRLTLQLDAVEGGGNFTGLKQCGRLQKLKLWMTQVQAFEVPTSLTSLDINLQLCSHAVQNKFAAYTANLKSLIVHTVGWTDDDWKRQIIPISGNVTHLDVSTNCTLLDFSSLSAVKTLSVSREEDNDEGVKFFALPPNVTDVTLHGIRPDLLKSGGISLAQALKHVAVQNVAHLQLHNLSQHWPIVGGLKLLSNLRTFSFVTDNDIYNTPHLQQMLQTLTALASLTAVSLEFSGGCIPKGCKGAQYDWLLAKVTTILEQKSPPAITKFPTDLERGAPCEVWEAAE